MSHTKEEWMFDDSGWSVNPYRVVVRKWGVHSVAVANCPAKATIPPEEAKANARLISAAPELLGALQWMVDSFYDDERWVGTPVYEAAMDAITKAIGQNK